MEQYKLITLATSAEGVAVLTLNRPEKLNAFNREMVGEWVDALDRFSRDDKARVLILTGSGRAFCTGGDSAEMLEMQGSDNLTRRNYLWNTIQRIPLAMERLDKPVIAAVNGTARGAGMDMALMCDLRIAASSATFAESYINMGVVSGDGGMYFLPRLIGASRALELFWTGRVIDAAEAERMGIMNRVVTDDKERVKKFRERKG